MVAIPAKRSCASDACAPRNSSTFRSYRSTQHPLRTRSSSGTIEPPKRMRPMNGDWTSMYTRSPTPVHTDSTTSPTRPVTLSVTASMLDPSTVSSLPVRWARSSKKWASWSTYGRRDAGYLNDSCVRRPVLGGYTLYAVLGEHDSKHSVCFTTQRGFVHELISLQISSHLFISAVFAS